MGLAALVIGICQPSSADAQSQYSSMTVEAAVALPYGPGDGAVNIYSQSLWAGRLFMGGWHTPADIGPDKLYVSNATQIDPVPVQFTNESTPGLVAGYHANDPSIVAPPSTDGIDRSAWLFMYFTCLGNQYATASAMFENNHLCWASSIDQGQSWTFLGEVIGQNNGLDSTGAWSPSAIVVGSEIWIYFHTNQPGAPRILVRRTNANGWQPIATSAVTLASSAGPSLVATNPRVIRTANAWFMTALNGNVSAQGNANVALYTSLDGFTWYPWSASVPDGSLIASGAYDILAPSLVARPAGDFDLYFALPSPSCPTGYSSGWGSCTYFDKWTFKLN